MSKHPSLYIGLSDGKPVNLPYGAYDDAMAILGRRGRGKTVTAASVIEGLHAMGRRFCFIDPTGVWHGLRSTADGKSPGLPVIVMGGDYGDVPLEPGSGKVIATFVANPRNPSTVLDLSNFDDDEAERFNNDFLRHLYKINRHRLHLGFDECQFIAPENPDSNTAHRMKKAAGKVFQMGRAKGLLPILISPRPSSVSKDCLYACGTMVVHGLTAPADQDSLAKWVKNAGTKQQILDFTTSLSKLPVGTAWVWSPDTDIFVRTQIRMRETFDSSKTAGGARIPKVRATVDLEGLKASIAETIAKADAEDPVKLQNIISQLRGELTAAGRVVEQLKANQLPDQIVVATSPDTTLPVLSIYKDGKGVLTVDVEMPKPPKAKVNVLEVKVPVFKNGDASRIEKAGRDVLGRLDAFASLCQPLLDVVSKAEHMVITTRETVELARKPQDEPAPPRAPAWTQAPVHKKGDVIQTPDGQIKITSAGTGTPAERAEGITKSDLLILTACAQFLSIGNNTPKRTAVAALAGYSASGGRFQNMLGGLRSKGLITYHGDGRMGLTVEGKSKVLKSSMVTRLTQEALWDRLREVLPPADMKIVDAFRSTGSPWTPITRDQLAAITGYNAAGGRYGNLLGGLKSKDIITYPSNGMVVLSDGLKVSA